MNEFAQASADVCKQIYGHLKSPRVGKIVIANKYDALEEGFEINTIKIFDESQERLSVNEVRYDVAYYEGVKLTNQNIILLGEEFGKMNLLTKIMLASKPKFLLNLMVGNYGQQTWFENVD